MNSIIIATLALMVLILFSAYFSATETAFSTLNRVRLKNLAGSGNKKASLALDLSEEYDSVLSTILIGNNIVNIAAASLATMLFVEHFGDAGVTISTIVMTIIVLIFGEISPKSLAKESAESFAMFSAPFLRLLMRLLKPLNFIFSKWKSFLANLISSEESKGITEEELIIMVEEATQDGEIEQYESDLIRNAIEFNDLNVSDVLTPRTELVAVSETDTAETIKQLFINSEFSRIPVYRDTIDNIIGTIHIKDFFRRNNDNMSEITKHALHTYETKKISALLSYFQEHKRHLAVVVDEYGGTLGIVTLEDIIEEIVGEIWDEHDEVIAEFEKISDDYLIVDGSASVEKLFRIVGIDDEVNPSTVNGWVIQQLTHWPSVGDEFEYENILVEVVEVENTKASKVSVKMNYSNELA